MNWERIEPWDYIVTAVAAEYHHKYNMVELGDIKQELYQWFLEHPNKLDEWEAIGHKDAKNLLYRSLRNQALDYCQKWKAKSLGYESTDLFYYDTDIVESLLPSVLLGYAIESPKSNLGMPGKPPAPSEGGNLMAMLVEIEAAYDKLSTADRKIIFCRYALSMDYAGIANELGAASEDAARMRHNRAIKKLIARIGGYKPYSDDDTSNKTSDDPDEVVSADDDGEQREREDEGE